MSRFAAFQIKTTQTIMSDFDALTALHFQNYEVAWWNLKKNISFMQ